MLNYQKEKWDEPRINPSDFKVFFESSHQAMFVENRDGYIVSVNRAACDLWRSSFNELIGKHASEVLPPKMGTSSTGQVRRSRYTRPDRTSIDVEVLSTPITLGEDEAFLTTVWRVAAEQELQQQELALFVEPGGPVSTGADELQSAKMEALERLAERLSHDFNNILTSVVGFSSLMRIDETLSDANASYLDQIADSASRAGKLTSEMISFGRIVAPPTTKFHPAAAIRKVESQIREILPDPIKLTTICEDGVAPIAGNEAALAQILVELATNTREANEGAAEGELKIELGSDESGAIYLRVSDDGPGMDESFAAAAFEPFFTSRSDRKVRGLGLARVYATTRNLGGSVSLRSEPGKGTQFDFVFPAAAVEPEALALPSATLPAPCEPATAQKSEVEDLPTAPAAEQQAPAAEHQAPAAEQQAPAPQPAARAKRCKLPGGSETILVVEDEPMVREIVVRSLSHLGYKVHKACDGQEGLELSRELADEIDLIFSDIVMPRLSGPEMVQRIREENRDTPVLFTTGFTESKHLLENGGDLRDGIDLLQKPYTPNVLAERVREKLDALTS